MSRVETIRTLLERWHELNDPARTGGGTGPGLTLMPHEPDCRLLRSQDRTCTCYRQSVNELERLLRAMREAGADTPMARHHLIARYLACEFRIQVTRRPSIDKHGRIRRAKGKVVYEQIRMVVTIYDATVDYELVDAGIEWIARSWRAAEPQLPRAWRVAA